MIRDPCPGCSSTPNWDADLRCATHALHRTGASGVESSKTRLHEDETMSALAWRPVGAVDPHRLGEARRQTHNAAQWLVRLARSYMAPQPHAQHTLLQWDSQRQALVTQEFLPQLTVELRIPELALQFKEDGRAVPHVIKLDDRTPAAVEAWVLVELLHRGIDYDRFSKSLPYELPDLMTGDAVRYVAEPLTTELNELATWFANAASVLVAVEKEQLRAATRYTPTLWCWPGVFHLAILLPMYDASSPMLRAGFSAGDDRNGQPYFYVALHDAKAGATPWPDAILTAASLSQERRPGETALDYVRAAIGALRTTAAK
jgi:hypothetical protein